MLADTRGWVTLPRRSAPRWWLPRGRATFGSLAVYHPVTARGRAGWRLARSLSRLGAQHLIRPGDAPPKAVREATAAHVPPGGGIAVMRANHPDRFVALVLDATAQPAAVAKVALSEAGAMALRREALALTAFAGQLRAPVTTPTVVAYRPGLLVTKAIEWHVRRRPWLLPVSVAEALGSLFRSTRTGDTSPVGAAHGDCAPWNLLWTGSGWALVDWEAAHDSALPFTDLSHFLVQAHTLLGRPRRETILAGLEGKGWVGQTIRAYSEAASLAPSAAGCHFDRYLVESMATLDRDTRDGSAGSHARQRFLDDLVRRRTR